MAYLNRNPSDAALPVRIGLIGSGWMGAFHAESIARRVPGAVLAAIADPNLESAEALAGALGTTKVTADAADILADPEIDAVVIASPARFHSALISQAAAAGKHVFCEKPAGLGLEELDSALAAVEAAGVHFQIGFNRRYAADFQAAKKDLAAGIAGQPQLLRSLTRDPGTGSIGHAARIPAWTIFLETLIHDFDTLNWFNEGAEPVEVYAVADALVEPGLRDQGFLDTAVVTIRYSNGAIAVAEANFSALYGYDVRGEVFGSRGHGPGRPQPPKPPPAGSPPRGCPPTPHGSTSSSSGRPTRMSWWTSPTPCAPGATARLPESPKPFTLTPGASDARRALAMALACIESVKQGTPVAVNAAAVL